MLTTQVENRDGIQLVHVAGSLDPVTYAQFKDVLDPLINREQARTVLDCERLDHVNSKILVLLVHYQRISGQNRSFLGLAALKPRIAKTIDMLGMGRLVSLYASVEDALQAAARA